MKNNKKLMRYKINDFVEYSLDSAYALSTKKLFTPLLVLITNYSCTLDCKYCSNLVPYIKKKQCFDVDKIQSDINTIAKVLHVNHVQVQGGEPFLHPHLDIIIKSLASSKLTRHINIATNGTIIIPEKLIEIFHDYKVKIRCGSYNSPKQKIAQIEQQCKENDIVLTVLKDRVWMNLGGIGIQMSNDESAKASYDTCSYNTCYTLSDGLFTKCARSATGHLNDLYTFYPEDHVNIRTDFDTLKHRLKIFMNNHHFMNACRYCYGGNAKEISVGEQLK